MTENRFGKGTACYVATDPEAPFLQAVIDRLCEKQKISPVIQTPPGVEATRRFRDDGEITFLINHNPEETPVLLDRAYRSLTDGRSVSGTVSMKPMDVLVLVPLN